LPQRHKRYRCLSGSKNISPQSFFKNIRVIEEKIRAEGGNMEIVETKQDEIWIFKLKGRLDSKTSPEFEKKIFDAIEVGSTNMIVDFEELDYISSAGLRVILKATKNLKRSDGRFVLCSMKDYVKEVFEISGFDTFLPIVSTMNEALNQS